jgi:Lar family restriction alleviation protein
MTFDLKPCPFCGGKAEMRTWCDKQPTFRIVCTQCGSMTRCVVDSDQNGYAVLRVLELWNTRTEKEAP